MAARTPRTKPNQVGEAQWRFILKTRDAIHNDPRLFFKSHNWRYIEPTTGGRYDSSILDQKAKKTTVEHFYVRPVTVWVPHLLMPNHIPCCPHCKKRSHVDIVKARWINCPKILFGISRYRYLDTVLYPCRLCGRRFAGYNKQSMQLDSSLYYGLFNFYLGDKFAVDEELHRFIVECSNTLATAMIFKKLKRLAYHAFYEDHQLYVQAIRQHKIRPEKKAKSVADMFPKRADNSDLQYLLNQRAKMSSALTKAKLAYESAKSRATTDWPFNKMLPAKENHNVHGKRNFLPGLGTTKLEKLISINIQSCFSLMRVNPRDYPAVKPLGKWQRLVQSYYDKLNAEVNVCKLELDHAENYYNEAVDNLVEYQDGNEFVGDESPTQVAAEVSDAPVRFSAFGDKAGYRGNSISKYRIDSLVMSVFHHRRLYQELKMRGLTACLLKIDFNYKLALKIRVWTKQGQSFTPFKCICTVQNEDGLTVFWKAMKHAESFSAIKEDLVRLRERLNRNRLAEQRRL